jgi:hypothetical protein
MKLTAACRDNHGTKRRDRRACKRSGNISSALKRPRAYYYLPIATEKVRTAPQDKRRRLQKLNVRPHTNPLRLFRFIRGTHARLSDDARGNGTHVRAPNSRFSIAVADVIDVLRLVAPASRLPPLVAERRNPAAFTGTGK